ncbi:efflux RND transporter periplasmic adaptor subunit [Candidatus Microgenomates bacterium]|nr:efflux RND transporter periplasmic adaptor subunit [Candidatus Microgenomates bacterium]
MFPKINIRRFFIGMVIGAIGLFLFTQTPLGARFLGRTPQNLETEKVVKKDLRVTVSASGSVTTENRAILRFQTPGKLAWIDAREGDAVTRGQALASLDATKLNADYQRALSDLRAAEATLERVYDEVKGHETDETFTQKEKRTLAEVAKDKAYEAVVKAQKDLNDATLLAPFDGIIATVTEGMVVGNNVSSGDTITLVGTQTIVFTALVDEADFGKVKTDQKVIVVLDAFPNEEFNGKVIQIKKVAEQTSTGGTAIPVKISLPQDQRFIIGLSGEAEFIINEKKDALVVPRRVIKRSDNDVFVYVLRGQERIRQTVSLGLESDREVEVTEGLHAGDTVIVDGVGDERSE